MRTETDHSRLRIRAVYTDPSLFACRYLHFNTFSRQTERLTRHRRRAGRSVFLLFAYVLRAMYACIGTICLNDYLLFLFISAEKKREKMNKL